MSSFEKNLAPLRSSEMSRTVGIGWQTRFIALFAALISTYKRILSYFFGTITTGDIQAVSSVSGIFMIISSASKRFNSPSTLARKWKGILRCRCMTGLTLLSTISSTCLFWSFPVPSNTRLCLVSKFCMVYL